MTAFRSERDPGCGKLQSVEEPLVPGLYETVETTELIARLSATQKPAQLAAIPKEDLSESLVQHVAGSLRKALESAKDVDAKVALTNAALTAIGVEGHQLTARAFELLSIAESDLIQPTMVRPEARMSMNGLITNAPGDPSVGAEIGAEITSADSIDVLMSFVKWSGLRVLKDQLVAAADRGVRIRVLTTTYMGATERAAVDRLIEDFGAEVRISYDVQSTRLHAKAWLFHRSSGLDSAYIGSSNLSVYAMVDGLEWNVRVARARDHHILDKFQATFDGYWNSRTFQPYDPSVDASRLDEALQRSGASRGGVDDGRINISGLEVSALPHQRQILEALAAERDIRNHHRNLVVAATGTGKTVVAALDYKELRTKHGDLTLLFVAHRKEILKQSQRMFREVLSDGSFGELLVDGERPVRWRHVFASIQGLSASVLESIGATQFDVVIIDEFHHAAADSYRRLLTTLEPRELIGLTATPERSDGINVSTYFDGRIAAELRLWDALEQDLLVPFHYFGVADDVSLQDVKWTRGAYDIEGLEKLYTGNDARATKIIRELQDKVTAVSQMRALGFCVSIAHAEYMARIFNQAGIPSLAVSSNSSSEERVQALARLRDRGINCLFAVDLFNEGLDIPQIDTVLFLRPTQSASVFLQQLGRGLRRADGKSVLTVLDFVGLQRQEFRFDTKLRALTGAGRSDLVRQIEHGFPYLPSGSRITLDRVAQKIILDNVRAQVASTQRALVQDIQSHGERRLTDYLRESGRDVSAIYQRNQSWTSLTRLAKIDHSFGGPTEEIYLKRVRSFAHVDDPERAAAYTALIDRDCRPYDELDERLQTFARMLVYVTTPGLETGGSYQECLAALRSNPAVCAEIAELMAIQADRSRNLPQPLAGLENVPLYSHSTYKREEVLAALGYVADMRRLNHREGVAWCPSTATDAFFVTLHKTGASFTETTSYRDYAISPDLFHWESQSTTARDSTTGQRYINHAQRGSHVVLFTRNRPDDEFGAGAPYVCLGSLRHENSENDRPIAIRWRLDREMPAEVFSEASAVAV